MEFNIHSRLWKRVKVQMCDRLEKTSISKILGNYVPCKVCPYFRFLLIHFFLLQVLIYLFKFESRISVRCPVRQCKKVFLDSRTFLQHVVKTHKDGIHFSKPSKTGNGSVVGFSEFLWKKCLSFWKSLLNPCYKIFWGAFVLVFRFFTSNFQLFNSFMAEPVIM